LNLPLFS